MNSLLKDDISRMSSDNEHMGLGDDASPSSEEDSLSSDEELLSDGSDFWEPDWEEVSEASSVSGDEGPAIIGQTVDEGDPQTRFVRSDNYRNPLLETIDWNDSRVGNVDLGRWRQIDGLDIRSVRSNIIPVLPFVVVRFRAYAIKRSELLLQNGEIFLRIPLHRGDYSFTVEMKVQLPLGDDVESYRIPRKDYMKIIQEAWLSSAEVRPWSLNHRIVLWPLPLRSETQHIFSKG